MKFGIGLSTAYEGLAYPIPFASANGLVELVKKAEDLGYDSVWPNDHMTVQNYVAAKEKVLPNFYESLVTLSAAAAVTERIQLATGLLPLPYREPALLAKQVCTLDQISGGRFALGIGIGAYREEFEAVKPKWKDIPRARIVDEFLECLRGLLTEEVSNFSGEFFQYKDLRIHPKPLQDPFPIYIGGNSEKALQRVAEYGVGWFPGCLSPEAIQERLARLSSYLAEKNRKLSDVDIAPQIFASIGKSKDEANATFVGSGLYEHIISLKSSTLKNDNTATLDDFTLIGTPDDIIAKVKSYEAAGVTHLPGLLFAAQTVEDFIKQMELFAKTVIVAFKK